MLGAELSENFYFGSLTSIVSQMKVGFFCRNICKKVLIPCLFYGGYERRWSEGYGEGGI